MNDQSILAIVEIANQAGFAAEYAEGLFTFTERESGIEILSVLQGEDDADTRILYNQLTVGVIPANQIENNGREVLNVLTGANNGISTSSFQTVEQENGSCLVLLNNYAPIQDLGDDDHQDITFTLQSLIADLCAACNGQLASLLSESSKAMAAS